MTRMSRIDLDSRIAYLVFALLGVLALVWAGLDHWEFTDYDSEAYPSISLLVAGDIGGFLREAPAYGGSLELRAPFAYLTDALGGGDLAVYRALGIPCLLALAALVLHVVGRSRLAGDDPAVRWLLVAVVMFNPIVVRALDAGHAEEILGAVFCVSAVLAGSRDRPVMAGILLGLAMGTKMWGVLAAGPVLLALPSGRVRALLCAGGVSALVMAPLLLAAHGTYTATGTYTIFYQYQVFWPLGAGGDPPAFITQISHPLIAGMVVPVSYAAWRARGAVQLETALGALAMLFLLRCVLDPWNIAYYAVPLILTVACWETLALRRAPIMAVVVTALTWFSFKWVPTYTGEDVQFAVYMAWTLPLGFWLAYVGVLGRSIPVSRALTAAARRPALPSS